MSFESRRFAVARPALLFIAAIGLGACMAHGGAGSLAGGSSATATKKTFTMADFSPTIYCPPLQIRPGTATLTAYQSGHQDDVNYVRHQASITQTARQCTANGSTLTVKVGVAGRVVAGPKGGAGTVTLPIRVAVAKQIGGKGPLYSQLFKVPVTLKAPDFSTGYEQVFDNVSFNVAPNERDLIVYVGFDEGKGK